MRMSRIGVLFALLPACSDPTAPGQPPPLESVPYHLLGTGKIAFERIADDYHAIYVIDPVAQTSIVVPIGQTFRTVAISPDGKQIASLAYSNAATEWDVVAKNVGGGLLRGIDIAVQSDGPPSWTADGTGLTFFRQTAGIPGMEMVDAAASDGARRRTLEVGAAPLACLPFVPPEIEDRIAVSVTGRIAMQCGFGSLVILSAEGTLIARHSVTSPAPGQELLSGFAWSPDGSALAIVELKADAGADVPTAVTLRILSDDATTVREVFTKPLTLVQNGRHHGANDLSVCWLRGTTRLLVSILQDARKHSQLWVVNEDGTALAQITTAPRTTNRSVSCAR